jgi:hypothetical protein
MPLVNHPAGNYRFLPGIAPYSCGVVSAPGFEIVHVTYQRPLPCAAGLEGIVPFLKAEGRPPAAVCGIELRSPQPFSFAGFAAFNAAYQAILKSWGVFVDEVNPVARTNVAPGRASPIEPVLYGFSYTRPAVRDAAPTFVVAGGGELPEGLLSPEAIVAAGDTSAAGIRTKAKFVMGLMENRLHGLGVDWSNTTAIDVYTIHPLHDILAEVILDRLGTAAIQAINWYYSRPPIVDIEFEMDARGVQSELRIR